MKIYLEDKQALAFYQQSATAEFWDRHWDVSDLPARVRATKDDGVFVPLVRRYLPAGSVVLEGGCGNAQLVHALQYNGYRAIGVDFALETIQRIKGVLPELDVRYGDLRSLDFPDASLDGYVSVGVVEHFWNGYGPIVEEMRRTLRSGGYLFVSFPYMSPLRRLKAFLKLYETRQKQDMDQYEDDFYQFALSPKLFIKDLNTSGFELKAFRTYAGIKGFKDEVALLRSWLQDVYDGKRARYLYGPVDRFLEPFASHCALLVMRKS